MNQFTPRWMHAAALALCVVCAETLQPRGAAAQKTELSFDANGGGSSFNDLCGPDQVLIGVSTKFSELRQVLVLAYAICKAVDGAGHWTGQDTGIQTMGFLFDGPTSYKTIRCAQDRAVESLVVSSINEVLELLVVCRALTANGTVTGSREEAGRVPTKFYPGFFVPLVTPSSQYSNFIKRSDIICPNSFPARALFGMGGFTVERIGLRCEAPFVAAKIDFQKTTLHPGEGNVGWVTMNRPNRGTLPIMISLSTNVTGVTVPAAVPLMPGADRVLFSFATPNVTSNTVVTITAKTPNAKGPGASGGFVIQP